MSDTQTEESPERHADRVTSPMQQYTNRDVLVGFLVFLVGLAVVVAPALLV